jgi:MarR family transcriptional regulator, 2-MHQ and catechol-resistance regulon repressor
MQSGLGWQDKSENVSRLTIKKEAIKVLPVMSKRAKITPSVAEQSLIRLMRIGDRFWRESDERFSRWGITDNHYNVLRILNGAREPLSQSEIGRRMLATRANVTKLVDVLEQKGYAQRVSCEDRRIKHIVLTDAGADFLIETLSEVISAAQNAMKPLTREEQKTLFHLLGKLTSETER